MTCNGKLASTQVLCCIRLAGRHVAGGRWQRGPAVPIGTNRLEGWCGWFKPRARLARGLKTEAGARNLLQLVAHAMA